MAHEIYEINNEWSMAYVGETPWHGLGQEIPNDASMGIWAKKAHLDWSIKETPVLYQIPDGTVKEAEGKKALFRSDDNSFLSVIGSNYNTVQPEEILEFFKSLIKAGDFRMKTAGSLQNGRRIWALAETGQSLRLMGQDRVDQYLLLATSCDGSLANTGMFTSVRVVCNNTLQMSISDGEGGRSRNYVKVPHSSKFNPEKMKAELGLGVKGFAIFAEKAAEMAKFKLSDIHIVDIITKLLAIEKKNGEKATPSEKRIADIIHLYKTAPGQELTSADGTLWGMVNAITRYTDHERNFRSRETNLTNAWFGNGMRLKEKMWGIADDLIQKAA